MEKKSEKYMINLYLDNERHKLALDYIEKNLKYAHILHDKDISIETGEILKPHIHVVLIFENARTVKSIAKELNIEENLIRYMDTVKFAIRYLIHKDQKEKYQYKKEDIRTNIDIDSYFKEKRNETEDIKKIVEFIYSEDKYIYFTEIMDFVLSEDLYASYRRGGNLISRIIEEHNKLFLEKREMKKKIEKEIAKWELENGEKN